MLTQAVSRRRRPRGRGDSTGCLCQAHVSGGWRHLFSPGLLLLSLGPRAVRQSRSREPSKQAARDPARFVSVRFDQKSGRVSHHKRLPSPLEAISAPSAIRGNCIASVTRTGAEAICPSPFLLPLPCFHFSPGCPGVSRVPLVAFIDIRRLRRPPEVGGGRRGRMVDEGEGGCDGIFCVRAVLYPFHFLSLLLLRCYFFDISSEIPMGVT